MTFLYGVSRFLFTALALSVVLSLFASYVVAMTVVPLFCAKLIKAHQVHERPRCAAAQRLVGAVSTTGSTSSFTQFLDRFDGAQTLALAPPGRHGPRHPRPVRR